MLDGEQSILSTERFPSGEYRRRWDYWAGLIDGGARPAVRSSTMI
jgi:hypothetical protein